MCEIGPLLTIMICCDVESANVEAVSMPGPRWQNVDHKGQRLGPRDDQLVSGYSCRPRRIFPALTNSDSFTIDAPALLFSPIRSPIAFALSAAITLTFANIVPVSILFG